MSKKGSKNLWEFRQAAGINNYDRFFLIVLVAAGIFSVLQFADWWFRQDHIANIWFFLLLSVIFWYGIARLILIWINYLGISKPEPVEAEKGLSVAIFTTSSPGEPLEMFEKTLAACKNITYPHTTYL